MSVDTLRETFHINRISTSDLQDFLTAQTYRPEITQAKNHILSLKNCSLQAVCTKPIQQGKSPKYAEKGLKCIKPKNTNDMLVSIDDIDWIDSSTKDQIQKQKLGYGDIVITRSGSGTIGRASIYCYSEEAYTNDHLFVVRPDKADSHYICSFLNSFHGQRLLEAGISGSTGQLNLSNEHIKSIPLFRPDNKAQKYIGDKVRQAEKLRSWAKRLEVRLALLENQIPISKPVTREAKHSKATLSYLTENRLDARYYANKHLDLYAQFTNSFESFGNICSKFKYGASITANYVNSDGLPFIRGNALSPNRINKDDIVYLNRSLEDDNNNYRIEEGDILITRSGTVGLAAHVTSEYAKYCYGSFIIKCTLSNKLYLPAYVSWYLNSWVGQQQFRRLENGAVQLNINIEELSSIAIWKASQEFQNEIQQLLFVQISAVNLSKLLANTAKTLVEALIEGHLTEQQLIQAQQALEDGDNSLDQAILSKLSAEGYAIEGAIPLFSDVDELYRLLEDAAQDEAEE